MLHGLTSHPHTIFNLLFYRPEGFLKSEMSREGRIEDHFVAVDAVSIVFIEVKVFTLGKSGLVVKGQVLA